MIDLSTRTIKQIFEEQIRQLTMRTAMNRADIFTINRADTYALNHANIFDYQFSGRWIR